MMYSHIKHIFLFVLLLSNYQNSYSQCIGIEGQVTWSYWRNLPAANFDELYSTDRFPNGPDGVRTVNSLASPRNFDNNFGGQVKGYIRVPSSGEVIFKVTGFDNAQFLLSTDENPANIRLVASATGYTESPTQTTAPILLQANQNYYFELTYTEISGADFAKVDWKTTFLEGLATLNWLPITSEYLADVCTNPCTDRGTPCDDGNAQTTNDQADGNCNCVGDPITTNTCVGERDILQPYIYEGTQGGYDIPLLEQLSTAENYPDAPDRLQSLKADWYDQGQYAESDIHNYGVRIQAYLSVPVTGNYSFNTTGTRATLFYLSSDDTEANKTANSIRSNGWMDTFEHDQAAEQTLTDVYLEAGKYYYTEFLHRSNSFYSFYSLFWKGPEHTDDTWRRIPTFYFFDYTCETACLKQGVACNDNNPLTANDEWDGACNCAGTPCTNPEDCDDFTTFYPTFDACETTMQVDNRAADAWLSCAPLSPNPNTARDGNHWIQYNFGEAYSLTNIHVWNYNVADATNLGFEQVVIDYSNDGVHWQELGNYTWNLATGLGKYGGFDLPNMPNITAQYVLITSLDPTTTCRGLSKVAFTAFSCLDIAFSTITDGQEFTAPANPIVTVTPTNENIEISRVTLYIGDLLVSTLTAPPYTWANTSAISNLPEGTYTLRVVTMDAEGASCSTSLQIHVTADEMNPIASCECDPLPAPTNTTIRVRTVAELNAALQQTNTNNGNRTILLEDGTYELTTNLLYIGTNMANLTLRSASGNRDAVTIRGQGMTGDVSHIFNVAASNFTLADMTIGWVANHPIQIHGETNADNCLIQNVRFVDGNEQLLKVSGSSTAVERSNNGIVQCCLFEFTAGIANQWYTGGIDAHNAQNWIVRNNTFKHIRSPEANLAEHAIHFWIDSEGTIVENNQIINCDRGIGFGLGNSGHTGGIIRNNMVHTSRDVGIGLESANNAKVYNNTVITDNYPRSIEYRFAATTNAHIANNLTSGSISARDGGTGTIESNFTTTDKSIFVDADNYDFHLTATQPQITNAGKILPEISIDYDCGNRSDAPDIGADQYNSGGQEECLAERMHPNEVLTAGLYPTKDNIYSQAIIESAVTYKAGNAITLQTGFHAKVGSNFTARIEDCTPNSTVAAATDMKVDDKVNALTASAKLTPISTVQIYPNPVQADFTVAFEAAVPETVSIEVYTVAGKAVRNLSYQKSVGQGTYTVRLSADALVSGLYYCRVRIGEEVWVESFVKGVF